MKKLLLCCLILGACTSLQVPEEFVYREIETSTFKLASWQKITDATAPVKFYIEGDGYAFTSGGRVSTNPTPRNTFWREAAFGDKHANVVYLARPCQYVADKLCEPKYWSTARFAPEVIGSEYEAIKQVAGNRPLILVGFSGGAQVAGLLAVKYADLRIDKLVTVAGNLDVAAWVKYHNLPPLSESWDLHNFKTEYAEFSQVHYIGLKDKNIVPQISKNFVGDKAVIIETPATHNRGWESSFNSIRAQ